MENVVGNINSFTTDSGNTYLKSNTSIFSSSFYFQDFYDDKLIKKFIKCTEAIIRQSKEYNDYLALIKTNYNILNFDNVLSHISDTDANIEIHHYPFTLYDIVDTIMTYHLANKENFTSFSIAKEVMEEHFLQHIGFVPLTKTNHELAHNGGLFISLKQVFGDWREFYVKYKSGISAELSTKIKNIEDLSLKNTASDYRRLY